MFSAFLFIPVRSSLAMAAAAAAAVVVRVNR
jgi:hypothetical protein